MLTAASRQILLEQPLSGNTIFDAEVSFNGYLSCDSDTRSNSDADLYRFKIRYLTSQTETRAGLQKINFGPALLLRPLRWFDRLDPRDPQHLTDGVYALRFKYNALNNANVWLWSLYGNDDPKGYEILPTVSDIPEFGGRFQHPVPRGEVAATFHTRKADASSLGKKSIGGKDFTENRLAFDGRWDIEIGLWFESVFQHQKSDVLPSSWQKMTTVGLDYTFGIGNGLHVLGEHMATVMSDTPFGWDDDQYVSAVSLSYLVGYFDSVSSIIYYSWEQQKQYLYLGWQRTYDSIILNFSLFDYQEADTHYSQGQNAFLSSYGARIMLIYNH